MVKSVLWHALKRVHFEGMAHWAQMLEKCRGDFKRSLSHFTSCLLNSNENENKRPTAMKCFRMARCISSAVALLLYRMKWANWLLNEIQFDFTTSWHCVNNLCFSTTLQWKLQSDRKYFYAAVFVFCYKVQHREKRTGKVICLSNLGPFSLKSGLGNYSMDMNSDEKISVKRAI